MKGLVAYDLPYALEEPTRVVGEQVALAILVDDEAIVLAEKFLDRDQRARTRGADSIAACEEIDDAVLDDEVATHADEAGIRLEVPEEPPHCGGPRRG